MRNSNEGIRCLLVCFSVCFAGKGDWILVTEIDGFLLQLDSFFSELVLQELRWGDHTAEWLFGCKFSRIERVR